VYPLYWPEKKKESSLHLLIHKTALTKDNKRSLGPVHPDSAKARSQLSQTAVITLQCWIPYATFLITF
jgi:hypothetical protein